LDLIPSGPVHQAVDARDPLMHVGSKSIDRRLVGEIEQ
jgi:hypothetical protein